MSDRRDSWADDSRNGRRPTSHERRAGQPWDASYRDGRAPWDVSAPQPAVVDLAREHTLVGPVLDAGCGTGENALHLASLGLSVVGVDVAETALEDARRKASGRQIDIEFLVADALRLSDLRREFRTVLDSGLFHTFDDDERKIYVDSLAAVTAHAGTLYVLCFSDREPGDWGPRRVTQEELYSAFSRTNGWEVQSIETTHFLTQLDAARPHAWLATIKRD